MKKFSKLVAIFAISIIALFSFTACQDPADNNGSNNTGNNNDTSIIGVWDVVMDAPADVNNLSSLSLGAVSLQIKEDKSFILSIYFDLNAYPYQVYGTWEVDDNNSNRFTFTTTHYSYFPNSNPNEPLKVSATGSYENAQLKIVAPFGSGELKGVLVKQQLTEEVLIGKWEADAQSLPSQFQSLSLQFNIDKTATITVRSNFNSPGLDEETINMQWHIVDGRLSFNRFSAIFSYINGKLTTAGIYFEKLT